MNDEELITTYVDGRMSEQERVAFEARLQMDAGLRRQVSITRLLADQSRQVEIVPAPKNFILPQDFGKAAQPVTPAPHVDLRRWFFRLSSVAAAVVFMFAVAFDTLRNALPATPVPAAAPMSATMQEAQAPEAAIATNVEPAIPTEAAAQAANAAGAAMPEATPMIQSRAMQTDSQPAVESAPESMESAPSTKAMPAPAPMPQAMEAPAYEAPAPQSASLLSPLRIIAGLALFMALAFGVVGWLRK